MTSNEKPSNPVYWLSVIHVVYLMSLPVLANITIVPHIHDNTINAIFWAIFGLLGVPIAFAAMMSMNPFPRDLMGAMMRTFFLPLSAGLWYWYQEGSLLEYFAVMLVYEFLAIYLSLFLMSFIPLKVYDPQNPKAGNIRANINILIVQGFLAAGGFMMALAIAIWPWIADDPYWYHPVTYLLLFIATVEYIISNFRWHRLNSHRWGDGQQWPSRATDNDVSIEPILLFSPVPWLISFWFIN